MSRPARGKLLLVMAFVLTLCAGIVVGMGLSKQAIAIDTPVAKPGQTPPPPSGGPGSWFADKLDLTPQQTEQMKKIWSDAMGGGRDQWDQRRALYRERDAAIEELYTEEQIAERERIKKEYEAKLAENSRQREKLVQVAVEQTKAMLSPEQRDIYEQMLKERAERDRDRHRGPSTRSSTQPSDRPPGPPPFGQSGRFDRRRGGDDSRDGESRDGESRGGESRDGESRSSGRESTDSGPPGR